MSAMKAIPGVGNPVILAEFEPGCGWVRQTYRKRASGAWLRKLKRAGVTHVELEVSGDRRSGADYSIEELLRACR